MGCECACAGQAAPRPVGQAAAAKAGADTAEEAGRVSRKASQTAPVTPLVSPREQEQGMRLPPRSCCGSKAQRSNAVAVRLGRIHLMPQS